MKALKNGGANNNVMREHTKILLVIVQLAPDRRLFANITTRPDGVGSATDSNKLQQLKGVWVRWGGCGRREKLRLVRRRVSRL